LQAVKTIFLLPITGLFVFVPLMFANVLQMLTVVLIPVSVRAFRHANMAIADTTWSYWGHLLRMSGTKIDIVGDALPASENVIVVANHQGMVDIAVLIVLSMSRHAAGKMKWLVKDVIKYVPGVGWGMLFLECVFLKRDWASDEGKIRATFHRLVSKKLPFWLMSFPEGSRVTPAKLAASQSYATARGLKPTTRVMMPRVKGFTAAVTGLRGAADAVYSVTIAYHDPVPSLAQVLTGGLRRVTMHVHRVPMSALPADEAGLGAWLLEDSYRKDELLSRLLSDEAGHAESPVGEWRRRPRHSPT
jgi:1-acyl-sn-glycerol-3-phosphate acyltransferase